MRYKGQITIFTSLLTMCLLSLFLRVFQSARMAGLSYYFELAGTSALESIFAGYNKELFQRYGLFFLDLPYTEIQNEMKDYFSYYGSPGQGLWKKGENSFYMECNSADMLSCITASDEGGEIFWQSAIDSMGYSMAEDTLNRLLGWIRLKEEGEEQKKRIEKEALSLEEFREFEELEELNLEHGFFDLVFQKAGGFHLRQLLPAAQTLSSKLSDLSEVPSKNAKKPPGSVDILKESAFLFYIQKNFSSFTSRKSNYSMTNTLDYEQEYILGGFPGDEENLSAVVGRLLLLREAMNIINVMGDESTMDIIQLVSEAIALILEIPPLEEPIKFLLITVIAYGYAVEDVKTLLNGGEIPLLKSETQEDDGLSYENYLAILMFTQNRFEKRYRTMDLIEMNLKVEDPGFQLDHCIWQLELRLTAVDVNGKERAGSFMRKYQ